MAEASLKATPSQVDTLRDELAAIETARAALQALRDRAEVARTAFEVEFDAIAPRHSSRALGARGRRLV